MYVRGEIDYVNNLRRTHTQYTVSSQEHKIYSTFSEMYL